MIEQQKAQLREILVKLNNLSALMLDATENTYTALSCTSCFGGDAIFSKCLTLLEEIDAQFVETYRKMKHVEHLCRPCPSGNAQSVQTEQASVQDGTEGEAL